MIFGLEAGVIAIFTYKSKFEISLILSMKKSLLREGCSRDPQINGSQLAIKLIEENKNLTKDWMVEK